MHSRIDNGAGDWRRRRSRRRPGAGRGPGSARRGLIKTHANDVGSRGGRAAYGELLPGEAAVGALPEAVLAGAVVDDLRVGGVNRHALALVTPATVGEHLHVEVALREVS